MAYENLERNGQAQLAAGLADDIMKAIMLYEHAVTVPLVLGVLEMVKTDIILRQTSLFVDVDEDDEDYEED